ncbi:peptide ABC transporter substrate-binding protein [Aerococcus urinae]|uniref:peptide ABC transporter substrate-binding protein n=1 Tax=Aerococcus urinae TaxID=1376 RepID=UPI000DCDC64B|nr:peptide ABC transporter substrate-binding protein [Aerococcus urinae]
MKVRKLVISLLSLSALALAGCSQNSKANEKIVHLTEAQEISTLDSSTVEDTGSSAYIGHIQDPLYWEDENNNVTPALAKEMPEKSEDGLTYTIKMRDDAKWSNGDPVTANDFVYAVQRLANPDTGASYAYLVENFENAEGVLKGDRPVEDLGVKALDDHTVEIKLAKPVPYMEHLLAFTNFSPLNKKFVEEKGDAYGSNSENVLASGPFKVEDWDGTGLNWKLVKNPDYYNADKVKIDGADVQVIKGISTRVNLFENGEVDNTILSGELVRQYKDNPNLNFKPKASISYIGVNHKNPLLANKDFRLALDYALDNKEYTEQILATGSTPISTFVPKGLVKNPETGADLVDDANIEPKVDVNKAQELWEKAKAAVPQDSYRLRILSSDDEGSKRVGEYFQGQLENKLPGLKVDLITVPGKNRIAAQRSGDFDLVLAGWLGDYADASNFLDCWKTDNPNNDGKYSNPKYDELLNRASDQDANDPQARYNDFLEAQKILAEDEGIIVLNQGVTAELRNPRVKGATYRSVGNEFDYRTATIDNSAAEK